jgi:hypothetical protein
VRPPILLLVALLLAVASAAHAGNGNGPQVNRRAGETKRYKAYRWGNQHGKGVTNVGKDRRGRISFVNKVSKLKRDKGGGERDHAMWTTGGRESHEWKGAGRERITQVWELDAAGNRISSQRQSTTATSTGLIRLSGGGPTDRRIKARYELIAGTDFDDAVRDLKAMAIAKGGMVESSFGGRRFVVGRNTTLDQARRQVGLEPRSAGDRTRDGRRRLREDRLGGPR